jgi:hypothetical protein
MDERMIGQQMIVSRKVKWKKVELIANAPLCPPGKKMKEPCPKWCGNCPLVSSTFRHKNRFR